MSILIIRVLFLVYLLSFITIILLGVLIQGLPVYLYAIGYKKLSIAYVIGISVWTSSDGLNKILKRTQGS